MKGDQSPLLKNSKKNLTIVIIGGGPAGSSCAIKLKRLAAFYRIQPRIILYEGKRFESKRFYNQCLGVLSPPLDEIIEEELGIPFPWEIIQRNIEGYHICTQKQDLKLSGKNEPSYACRRIEFDNYLFQSAKALGIETIQARVTEIDISTDSTMVFSESNNIRADVIVGAFGLDDGMAKLFERATHYRQPKFIYSVVTKVHPDEKNINAFGNDIYAFLPENFREIEFGAITPKGNHLSLNIAGRSVDSNAMDRFLRLPIVKKVLPIASEKSLNQLYYFKGKFPTLPGKAIFGDRYVMVGDAAGLIRPFKGKGINSAVVTGIKAAETIMSHGISKRDFLHYKKSCSELTGDIPYGKALRFLTSQCRRFRLIESILRISEHEEKLKKALFNIVSGHQPYKKIWKESGGWKFLIRIGFKTLHSKIFLSNKTP